MSFALITRSAFCSLLLALSAPAVHAGGYGGGSAHISPIAPSEARAMLSYADRHRDGHFRVEHVEASEAEARIGPDGEIGAGYALSDTRIENSEGFLSWKRSVQRTNGHAANGQASGDGFSASFVKVQTNDGKFYMFKGMTSTGASANRQGASSSQSGLAKSASGRF